MDVETEPGLVPSPTERDYVWVDDALPSAKPSTGQRMALCLWRSLPRSSRHQITPTKASIQSALTEVAQTWSALKIPSLLGLSDPHPPQSLMLQFYSRTGITALTGARIALNTAKGVRQRVINTLETSRLRGNGIAWKSSRRCGPEPGVRSPVGLSPNTMARCSGIRRASILHGLRRVRLRELRSMVSLHPWHPWSIIARQSAGPFRRCRKTGRRRPHC